MLPPPSSISLNSPGPLLTYKVGGGNFPPSPQICPPLLELVLPLKKCPFFKRLLFFYWETQRNATYYNTTLHDSVQIGPFDAICPPQNEQLLKEALQFSLSGHQPPSIIILYHSHCAVFQQVFMHIIDFFWYFFLHKFRKSIIVQHPPPISLNHHSWRQPPSPIVE